MRRLAILAAGAALIASGTAAASPPGAVDTVVGQSGETHGRPWRAFFSGHEGERCVGLQVGLSLAEVCGEEPESPWRRVVGNGIDSSPAVALELDLTSTAVRTLKLVIGHPDSRGRQTRPSTRRTIRTRRLTAAQARQAGIERDFRYAVIASKTPNECVKRVVAIARDGERLMRSEVPCEF